MSRWGKVLVWKDGDWQPAGIARIVRAEPEPASINEAQRRAALRIRDYLSLRIELLNGYPEVDLVQQERERVRARIRDIEEVLG